MRAASLCAGIGGADLALEALGFDIAWHAEVDPDASAVLAHHWPGVPNVGDIKAADWSQVEPVDVIVAGYPCQGESTAGLQRGTDDPRWLWPAVRDAVVALRPRVLLIENVRNHLRKSFPVVLADLAALGFDAEWGVLGSADVGGCHRRERLWVAATDTSGGPVGPEPVGVAGGGGALVARLDRAPAPHTRHDGRGRGEERDLGSTAGLPAPRRDDAHGRPVPADVSLLPTPRASAGRTGRSAAVRRDSMSGPSLEQAVEISAGELPREFSSWEELPPSWQPASLLPTPTSADGKGGPGSQGRDGGENLRTAALADFGRYQAAVDRWAAIFGPPPSPTEPNTKGGRRLHAPFPEWMIGFPAGWVTDHVGRAAALRCIGNAIQPQTAVVAWGELLARIERTAVAS